MGSLRMIALCVVLAASAAGCRRAEPLPELGKLSAFALEDQAGRAVTQASFSGKPWIAAFMFTRCPTICPRITSRMKELQAEIGRRGIDARLVSLSVDPEYDTPSVLSAYAVKHGVNLASWSFLTGNSAVIKDTAERGFKLGLDGRADASAEHFGITHGSHLVLVDRELRIRGYYRSSEDAEMKRLLADLEQLSNSR